MDEFDHEIKTVLHPEKKSRIELFTLNAANSQNKRKRKLNDDKVDEMKIMLQPTKKPRLELVQLFGQDSTWKEFEDVVFKFVRCESDLNDPIASIL